MDNDFASAVTLVRTGQVMAIDAAAGLVSRLSGEEKLGLLDGDQSFWAGMGRMVARGYNRSPVVAGAVPRLGCARGAGCRCPRPALLRRPRRICAELATGGVTSVRRARRWCCPVVHFPLE